MVLISPDSACFIPYPQIPRVFPRVATRDSRCSRKGHLDMVVSRGLLVHRTDSPSSTGHHILVVYELFKANLTAWTFVDAMSRVDCQEGRSLPNKLGGLSLGPYKLLTYVPRG